MAQELETFESGTNGNSFLNSSGIIDGGSDGTGTWKYDNTFHVEGSLGSKLDITTASAWIRFMTFSTGLISQVWVTASFKVTGNLPNSAFTPILAVRSSGTNRAQLGLLASGAIRMRNNVTATGTDGTVAVVVGNQYTLRWHLNNGTGQDWQLYDSTGTLIDSASGGTFNTGTVNELSFGTISTPGRVCAIFWDRVGYDSTAAIVLPFINIGASAAATASGSADSQKVTGVSASAAVTAAGSADTLATRSAQAAGVATATGTADSVRQTSVQGSSGAVAAGTADAQAVRSAQAAAAVTAAGSSDAQRVQSIQGSLAVTATGSADAHVVATKSADAIGVVTADATASAVIIKSIQGDLVLVAAGSSDSSKTMMLQAAGVATAHGTALTKTKLTHPAHAGVTHPRSSGLTSPRNTGTTSPR